MYHTAKMPSKKRGTQKQFRNYSSNRRHNTRSRGQKRGQKIDPRRFIKEAKHVTTTPYVPQHTFNDFALHDSLKRNLVARNFTQPTQIQDQTIPMQLAGSDIIGIANTGTGKTAAFLLPLLHKIMTGTSQRVLIVAPTRELAQQISQESRAFSAGIGIRDALLIGGTNIRPQFRDLERNPDIIIGTPGRIKDHIERKTLRLDTVQTVVLDEVDRMLDMGFINDIRTILGRLPNERQSLFFSATMSPTIDNLIRTFTKHPQTVTATTAETSDNVEQSIMHYFENKDRLEKLHDLLISEQVTKTLVFCETKRTTEKLGKELGERGYKVDAMHGNKSQGQRQRALRKFKSGEVTILVATDVAARGIDVDGITHVINYDVPQTYDDYTHRIGRTGRGSSVGKAITFVTH